MRLVSLFVLLFIPIVASSQVDFTYSDNNYPCARSDYTFTPNVTVSFDSLVWNFGDGNSFSTTTSSQVSHSFPMAGYFTVTLTAYSAGSNVGSASKKVLVYDQPNLKMEYEAPSLVCAPRDSVFLTVDTVNIEPPDLTFTIDWGDGTSQKFTKDQIGKAQFHVYRKTSCGNHITVGNMDIYDKFLITVSATNMCAVAPVFLFRPVDIKSKPNVGFSVEQVENLSFDTLTSTYYICDSGQFKLKNLSYGNDNCLEVNNVQWKLYDDQGQLMDECLNTCIETYMTPLLRFGKYRVVLTQDNACGADSVAGFLEIRQAPRVSFLLSEPVYCYPARVDVINTSSDSVIRYWWDFIGDSSQVIVDTQKLNHSWLYQEQGTYTIKLWGTDGYCRNEHDTTLDLTNRCKDIYVPNAFLPDSKNPLLNTFKPKAQDLVDYRIDIYDMYGKHIWSSTALDENGCPSEGWDGTCPDGKPCPAGTYIWVIKATISYGDLGQMQWDGQVYNNKGKRSPAGTVILIRN